MNTTVNQVVAFGALLSLLAFISCSFEQDDFSIPAEEIYTFQPLNPDEVFYFEEAGIYIKKTDAQEINATKGGAEQTKTFYATRFFPKSIEEQLYLGSIEEVAVSYIPWGYDPVPDVVVTKSGLDDVNTFQTEKDNPYYIESVVDTDTTILHLPVMYALWPEELDYPDVEYEVIERVEIQRFDPEPSCQYTLFLRTYDSLLGTYVPLKNMKVHFKLGSFSVYMTTNAQGRVQITPSSYYNAPSNISNINVYVLPETSRFTVARKQNSTNTTIAIVEVLGTLGSLYGYPGNSNPLPYTATLSSNTTEYEAFRAADYYFSDSHLLSSSIASGETGILILANDDACGTTLGNADTVYNTINVFNSGTDMEETIATTLHEIGHIRHCQKNPILYNNYIDQFVRESYASFVGWALGEQYYTSKGFVKPYHGYQINTNGNQAWVKTMSTPDYYYSPIFVDLWDNYNQSQAYTGVIPETIWISDLSVVEGMASQTTLLGCLSYLYDLVGQEISLSDYNLLLNYYL